MHYIAGRRHSAGKCGQCRMRRQGAIGNRSIDSRQILHHHAARPDVHMTNLGIANLAVRQPDIGT